MSHIIALQEQVSDLQAHITLLWEISNYYAHRQPDPQPNPDPLPENVSLPSVPADTSRSQIPLPDDIDELGPVVFSNHRHH